MFLCGPMFMSGNPGTKSKEWHTAGKVVAGLTGTFGSGKSTVARFFEQCGAFVVDADKLAHEALIKGRKSYKKVAEAFPQAVDPSNSQISRKVLAATVFKNPEDRKKLESIIHPYVFERIGEEVTRADSSVIILEIPLLFETGFDKYCSSTITVYAKDEVIKERLERKGLSGEEARKRKEAQWTLEEKCRRADIIIDNSCSLEETKHQVQEVWKKLAVKNQ